MSNSGTTTWSVWSDWSNNDAYDSDFMDSDISAAGDDNAAFDPYGGAIAFYTGHGSCGDYFGNTSCTTAATCTAGSNPVCVRGGSPGTCLYYTPQYAETCSTHDSFSHQAVYSAGLAKWGESSTSGKW